MIEGNARTPSVRTTTRRVTTPRRRPRSLIALLGTLSLLATLTFAGTAAVSAAPASEPACVDLIAGQHTEVGEVCVENDSENLSVTYTTSGGWLLSETHLAVSADAPGDGGWTAEGWQNPAGNPAPGRFPHSEHHDPAVDEFTYTIPLAAISGGVAAGAELHIAAHAAVTKEEQVSDELVANGSFETPVVETTQGWDIFPDGTADLGWSVAWTDAVLDDHDEFMVLERPDPALMELHRSGVGDIPAAWAASEGDQYTELDSDWDGPGGEVSGEPASVIISQAIDTSGYDHCTLSYAWSPRPGHDDNAIQVRWGGAVVADHAASGADNDATDWTIESHVVDADGTVLVEFEETGEPDSLGMFLDAVSVVCTEVLPEPLTETAWGDGDRFVDRGNWAMHFSYTVQ